MRHVFLLFACQFLVYAGTAQPVKSVAFDTVITKVFTPEGPGAVVLVAKKGEVIYKKAFGMADLELKVPMQTGMVFRIGSITKQFTAVTILQLVERGKLSLQDDIKKFIPDYPSGGHTITIEHLLTHTSGIKSYTNMQSFGGMIRKDMTPAELIDVFKNEPMEFAPGTKWNYNNSGYILLGAIIEKVSGKTYAQYVQDHLFGVAGMPASGYGNEKDIIPNRARGYSGSKNKYVHADYLSMTLPYAAGSLISTVDDLYRWNRAVHSYKLVSKTLLEKAFTNYTLISGKRTNYGYGWAFSRVQGSPSIEHSGGIHGFQSDAVYLPAEDIFVVILSNCNCNPPASMTHRLAAIAMGKPYIRNEIAIDENMAKEYAGIYENEDGVLRTISVEGSKVYSKRGEGSRFRIIPFEKDKFFFEGSLTTITFFRNNAGTVEKLLFASNEEESEWTRTEKTAPPVKPDTKVDEAILKTYTGDYELAPGFLISITLESGHLMAQATGQEKFELFAGSPTKFFLKVVEAQLEFFKDGDGGVTHLVLYQNGQTIQGKKVNRKTGE